MSKHHQIYTKILNLLTDAILNKSSEFHNFVFSNINDGRVESRYIVLRDFIEEDLNLIFFTDKRSPKLISIIKNNKTTCLFYSKTQKIQLRVTTESFILDDQKKIKKYWDEVPLISRKSYSTELPPSSFSNFETDGLIKETDSKNSEYKDSFKNFSVIENYIKEIDFLSLNSEGHRRARVSLDNKKFKLDWLIP